MSSNKTFVLECGSCESSFIIDYEVDFVSKNVPEICPFCGEPIDGLEDISDEGNTEEDVINEGMVDEWD